jgi:hypothetical protein
MTKESSEMVSLRDYIDTRLAALEGRHKDQVLATQIAIDKADAATALRFAAVNEFRAQLADQSSTFVTRREHEVWGGRLDGLERLHGNYLTRPEHEAFSARLDAVEKRFDTHDGRGAGLTAGWGYLIGGVGFVIAIAALMFDLLQH